MSRVTPIANRTDDTILALTSLLTAICSVGSIFVMMFTGELILGLLAWILFGVSLLTAHGLKGIQ